MKSTKERKIKKRKNREEEEEGLKRGKVERREREMNDRKVVR